MKSKLTAQSWLVAAGRGEGPGSPLNVPIVPASNFTLGGERVYARDSGSPGWEALEEIIGGLEGGVTHDPQGDRILFDAVKEGLRKDIPVIEAPLQVNEEAFADLVVKEFVSLMSR